MSTPGWPDVVGLKEMLVRAKVALDAGEKLNASRLLAEAIDVTMGAHGPGLRVSEPATSWFTIADGDSYGVVERVPARREANILICWCSDPGEAQLIALLLVDNAGNERPRMAITGGRRIEDDDA